MSQRRQPRTGRQASLAGTRALRNRVMGIYIRKQTWRHYAVCHPTIETMSERLHARRRSENALSTDEDKIPTYVQGLQAATEQHDQIEKKTA